LAFKVDKTKLIGPNNVPLTQSLFLEFNYEEKYAYFTFADEDKEYRGKTYYSLKRLFLEAADPTEYRFATEYLLGWNHWKRLNENKALREHFDKWREELEVMLRSEALQDILQMTDNFQARKWLADRGWEKRAPGRPSKSESERDNNIQERIANELDSIVVRMDNYKAG
jgi:hypothetical protein